MNRFDGPDFAKTEVLIGAATAIQPITRKALNQVQISGAPLLISLGNFSPPLGPGFYTLPHILLNASFEPNVAKSISHSQRKDQSLALVRTSQSREVFLL
ncbi:MAG: hypothetical protein AAF674_22760 [Pseudomonadota bacterium]